MNNLVRNLAIGAVALAGVIEQPAVQAQERSPDAKSLEQLARSGSDLKLLHEFDFTLRFPSQKAAASAEAQLITLAFATRIEPGKIADERVLRGLKKMYPVESDLAGLRDKLNTIAAAGHGVYEGWRAKPVSAGK